ncbi:MAG: YraN family protein [Syntrophobacterales bacterium RBG_19FT_COMBO_59_10]|nr:MAG: YraN family protein [Syntrophobacterales bacterium RBG_19FT_COMBO_59_10]
MSLAKKILGREGEDRAAQFLKKQGYKILERNYSTPQGEIDLIALHRGEVVFVEVKTRTNDAYGAPELAVNPRKQKRMVKAALGYIKYKKLHQVPCRFDVVAINAAAEQAIDLIENAFEMDRTYL